MHITEPEDLSAIELFEYFIGHQDDTKALTLVEQTIRQYARTRPYQDLWELDNIVIRLLDDDFLPMPNYVLYYQQDNKQHELSIEK